MAEILILVNFVNEIWNFEGTGLVDVIMIDTAKEIRLVYFIGKVTILFRNSNYGNTLATSNYPHSKYEDEKAMVKRKNGRHYLIQKTKMKTQWNRANQTR